MSHHFVRADAKRGVDWDVREANDRIALRVPLVSRRAAQGFAAARVSAPSRLTSRRLFERSERSERSEFGAAAKTEQRRAVGPRPTDEQGRLFFGDFLLAKQKKVTTLSGAHPDAVSRSRKKQRREAPPSCIHAFAGMTRKAGMTRATT
jgi:hypothetical protein